MPIAPSRSADAIATLTLAHLQRVVAIDSQSDEASTTLPTTEGQRHLADHLAAFYAGLGATVERDANANVLAWFPGRGALADRAPVAFLVHLDTARGTRAVPSLHVVPAWDGSRVPFPKNRTIQVDIATYPEAAVFLGQDLVHGPGDAPFGLDDKLGLAECLATAELLAAQPDVPHPPLVFVARPDEEVGRHEAVVALAGTFAERGVRFGYTVDGILPFEVNVENFNAAQVTVTFPPLASHDRPGVAVVARIGGVNTHGATAKAEGHRAAPRLAAEWLAAMDHADAAFTGFVSNALRDCDALVHLRVAPGAGERVRAALEAVMAPHLARGASWSLSTGEGPDDFAAERALEWIKQFYASEPGFPLACEDSAGRDGYSHPYRMRPSEGGLRLDLRLRDFDPAGLQRRIDHVLGLAGDLPVELHHQYVNMGPRLAAHPELVAHAQAAAADIGVPVVVAPIRGGTGVDPFLDAGVPIANLGTGYFAPESEKELTSRQMMARHVEWLFALVQRL
ncbi:MAG: M20/M25/M40 family metallo-hydrolase [Pseudomonadota bacterium]|nr:M20/M25/M40 family metallo-hydrolase [Pseudomonadota bacterium]